MKQAIILALGLTVAPLAALAMPAVGDMVGTNPEDASAALAAAGCTVAEFEAEDGMIEAKCHDADQKLYEVYIDPKTGEIAKIKDED